MDTADPGRAIVSAIEGISYHRAPCCSPLPGDDVFGFVTRGRGVSIHRHSCINAASLKSQPERLVTIQWPSEVHRISVPLDLEATDRVMLADVVTIITRAGINITRGEVFSSDGADVASTRISLSIEVNDTRQLSKLCKKLANARGVLRVLSRGAGDEFSQELYRAPAIETGRDDILPLIGEVNSHLVELAHRRPSLLRELTPRLFEEFVAELFDGFGYAVELTAQTRDGGRDLVAVRRHDDVLLKYLVECKYYSPQRPVGVGHVRALLGAKHDECASKAILVTSSFFSAPARELEERHIYELELRDYLDLQRWIAMYNEIISGARLAGPRTIG